VLTPMHETSREDRIRDLFLEAGGMSTAEFTHHCRDVKIWSDDEWNALAFRSAQAEVRKALRKLDASGLPFAGQTTTKTEDGAHVWMTRQMWVYEDYALNISELVEQRDKCHETAVTMADECRGRFGRSPSLGLFGEDVAA
jgi:hypothetical protein